MKVLGIDPGLLITGYGLLERDGGPIRLVEGGTIESGDAKCPLPERLRILFLELSELVGEHHPDVVALEQLYSHYEHPRTAILMGHARGVICLVAGLHDIPLYHYASTQVKNSMTGNGRASKVQIQQAVRHTFSLPAVPEPPDVADAIAIALCHLNHEQSNEMARSDYLPR